MLNHLVLVKSKKQLLPAIKNNEQIDAATKSPIRKIQNDLKSNRLRQKSEMNAYRDYAKWRDQVLTNQNDCALRCVEEEEAEINVQLSENGDESNVKSSNLSAIDCANGDKSQSKENCVDKPASSTDKDNCDSESESQHSQNILLIYHNFWMFFPLTIA